MRFKISKSPSKSFDQSVLETLTAEVSAALGPDATTKDTDELLAALVGPTLDRLKVLVVDRLRQREHRMIREHRRYSRGFERRLRRYWGSALDRFYAIVVCAEESGSDFNDLHRQDAANRSNFLFDALSGLHARACRASFEVHQLLLSGFTMAALARCRTMHELAVTSMVLADYGSTDEFADVAERYILHEAVLNYKDALEYQFHCESLNIGGLDDTEFAKIKARRDVVVARFGKSFNETYGWAVKVTSKDKPTFLDLERLANLGSLRSFYRWASHEVHPDSKGWRLNLSEWEGVTYMSTGHANFGLSEPGQLAMVSLNLCTVSFLMCIHPVSAETVVRLLAINELIVGAQNLFVEGERQLATAEEVLRHRINSGLR